MRKEGEGEWHDGRGRRGRKEKVREILGGRGEEGGRR